MIDIILKIAAIVLLTYLIYQMLFFSAIQSTVVIISKTGEQKEIKLLSLNKPVTVDPLWINHPGANLVDGSLNTFTQTADWVSRKEVSVEIDLLQEFSIVQIRIFNRKDCCWERFGIHSLLLDDKVVFVQNADGAPIWEYNWSVDEAPLAQKVKIQMDGILSLSEVEIWGFK